MLDYVLCHKSLVKWLLDQYLLHIDIVLYFYSSFHIGSIMMEEHYLLQLLLATTTITSTSTFTASTTSSLYSNYACYNIVIRLLLVLFIGIFSLWANFEASKGFDIIIINDVKDTPAGQCFTLFYVSDDKATRIVLNTSQFVENLLYDPNYNHHYPKKVVNHVTLRLASQNFTHTVTNNFHSDHKKHDYVINITPLLFEEIDVNYAMVSLVQRSMSRIWLWDGESSAPLTLLGGLVEYISMVAGFGHVKYYDNIGKWPEYCDQIWWEDKDPKIVAHYLGCFEGYQKGFIQRLNQPMKDRWQDRMVEDVLEPLGYSAQW